MIVQEPMAWIVLLYYCIIVLDLVYLTGVKKYATPTKTGSRYLLGVLFNISNEHPFFSTWEFPSLGCNRYGSTEELSSADFKLFS